MAEQKKSDARKQADPDMARRKLQLLEAENLVKVLTAKSAANKKSRDAEYALLDSVVSGLQLEVDKLLKKSPADAVTDMMLEQVNQIIRDCRILLADDTYVQRQKEFVAAGENPQVRDVSLALTQLRQGLQRYRATGKGQLEEAEKDRIHQARTIQCALWFYVDAKRKNIRADEIRSEISGVSKEWLNQHNFFDFARLDETDLKSYFALQP
jgi:hypothetical protein